MTAHNRKLKTAVLELDGTDYAAQLTSFKLVNNTDDGDKTYTYAADGEFREETDDDYALELKFVADWRDGGISRFLTENDREIVDFTLGHIPTVTAEHGDWSGEVVVKAPDVGGDVRDTEMTEITLQVIGKPVYTPEA